MRGLRYLGGRVWEWPLRPQRLSCCRRWLAQAVSCCLGVDRISNEWSSILVFEASEDFISDASLVPAEEDELETQLNFSSHFSIGP